ncbi:hypothetical protein NC661_11905 [Aquibacillus koreensis]|uniref:Uncharacterized protein n=1 Tax=Aquibacillus koreensis TaxID=279446 RepID=A0A9X4AK64_9BACI|nr:hypothetical protein [Aquibacillus koreensis]MCT2535214.1 hypothetical protein [Aquibacillus koreensis]MDC3421073.1 hypothetical protein [Aquibacillus koreensis]
MNHEKDYDRDFDREDHLSSDHLRHILQSSHDIEVKLMREYLIAADRIHDNPELKERLKNFAEGNAKRTDQLLDELKNYQ